MTRLGVSLQGKGNKGGGCGRETASQEAVLSRALRPEACRSVTAPCHLLPLTGDGCVVPSRGKAAGRVRAQSSVGGNATSFSVMCLWMSYLLALAFNLLTNN